MSSLPPFNFNQLMQEAEKMQKRMQDARQRLSQHVVVGHAGAGAHKVSIEMNGRYEALKITLPHPPSKDDALLAELIKAAFNDAVHKIETLSEKEISSLTAGISVPDLTALHDKRD